MKSSHIAKVCVLLLLPIGVIVASGFWGWHRHWPTLALGEDCWFYQGRLRFDGDVWCLYQGADSTAMAATYLGDSLSLQVSKQVEADGTMSYYTTLRELPPGGLMRFRGFFDPPLYPTLKLDAQGRPVQERATEKYFLMAQGLLMPYCDRINAGVQLLQEDW